MNKLPGAHLTYEWPTCLQSTVHNLRFDGSHMADVRTLIGRTRRLAGGSADIRVLHARSRCRHCRGVRLRARARLHTRPMQPINIALTLLIAVLFMHAVLNGNLVQRLPPTNDAVPNIGECTVHGK